MNPRLTIAIPTYNRAELLRRALESAIAQTSSNIAIYVSDNGSSDSTPEVIAEYSDPRLRSIRRQTTVSRAQHGTLLFSEIATEFVVILSDDDFLEPDFSVRVLAIFERNPGISFAYTGCQEHYDDVALPALVGPEVESGLDFLIAHFSGRRHVSWCACVTRMSDLRRYIPQPENRIIGDMYFWTRIAFQGPVGCVARPLSHYTVLAPGGDNESRTVPILEWAAEIDLLCREVMERAISAKAPATQISLLHAATQTYLTRSIANQFLWARIYGMSRLKCIALLGGCIRYSGWHASALIRIAGAIVMTRRQVRRAVTSGAARLASRRRRAALQQPR